MPEPPISLKALAWGGLPTNAELPEPKPIFPRIDKEEYLKDAEAPSQEPPKAKNDKSKGKPKEEEKKPLIAIDQFFETELKVATITHAERVPKSEKLSS